jgi:hypothetical protein
VEHERLALGVEPELDYLADEDLVIAGLVIGM